MKLDLASVLAAATLLTSAEARHGHDHGHHHQRKHQHRDLDKRGGQCQFPSDAGLVAITPHMENAGWAMSPNQPCRPGNYCPYACPPGQVSMQWDPKATSYSYPMSMNGGLYCDENGQIQKPFPNKPYCVDGTGSVGASNKCSKQVSFCQTVLPGNEAMLIPTLVEELQNLAVPGTDYWCETAAHYYINPPGIDAETACVWGTSANPYGNWSPYVAGANTVSSGDTFVKIGWNPIYLEPTTPFRNEMPDFGVEIVCEGDSCNGLPCKIDPDVNGVNEMVGSGGDGAGGAAFCVVTVPKGEKAHVVVFEKNGGGGGQESVTVDVPTSSPTPVSTSSSSTPTPTPTPSSTSSSTSSTPTPSTSSTPTPTPTSSSTSSPVISSVHSPSLSSSSRYPTSSASPSSKLPMTSPSASYTYSPHVFIETGISGAVSSTSTSTPSSPSSSSTSSSSASTVTVPMGFVLSILALVFNQ